MCPKESADLLAEVVGQGVQELVGGEPRRVPADQQRQVLGHLSTLDGLDAHLLERLGELRDLRRAVDLAAVGDAPGPGEDRRDRVGRRLLALLPLPVVPGDGAVRRLRLDGLAVGGHQHRRHQAQRAVALRDGVALHVAVVVLAGPDEAALPLQRGGDHVVDEPVLVGEAGGLELSANSASKTSWKRSLNRPS